MNYCFPCLNREINPYPEQLPNPWQHPKPSHEVDFIWMSCFPHDFQHPAKTNLLCQSKLNFWVKKSFALSISLSLANEKLFLAISIPCLLDIHLETYEKKGCFCCRLLINPHKTRRMNVKINCHKSLASIFWKFFKENSLTKILESFMKLKLLHARVVEV